MSRWSAPERQGSALGVYALGNIGQSIAVFLGPVLAAQFGMPAVFRGVAVLLLAWALVLVARDAPRRAAPTGAGDMLRVLLHERLSWLLAAFYFCPRSFGEWPIGSAPASGRRCGRGF